ncbi:MAG: helix-turn-helix transcriptional regulator [Alphaproteobacteria bacterium]
MVGQAYQAALQPSEWAKFLRALADATGSVGAGLHWTSKVNGAPIFLFSTGITDEGRHEYAEHYVKTCPRFRGALMRRSGEVFVDYDVITEHEMDRHELYTDFLARHGLRYFSGIIALDDDAQHCGFDIERSPHQGHFDGDELDLVRRLAPHLSRAVQMQQHLGVLSAVEHTLTAALDRLHLGVIFVDAAGRPILMNSVANAIIGRADGLGSTPQGIVAATTKATRALRRAIGEAAATSTGNGLGAGRALVLPRPSGAKAFEVIVSPLPGNADRIGLAGAAAVLFVSDPESGPRPPLEALQQLFGLTPAEAELAAALARGRSLTDFAVETGRRIQTVRKTAKQIFSKTETTRQAELVARLLKGPAGLASTDNDEA